MGTPEFALNSIKTLDENHDIIGIFTKIDKPNSRGKKIKFNPIKQYGLDNDITVYQPNSVKTEETLNLVRELNPDLIVVPSTPGEQLLYDSPLGSLYTQSGGTLWYKQSKAPNVWTILQTGSEM